MPTHLKFDKAFDVTLMWVSPFRSRKWTAAGLFVFCIRSCRYWQNLFCSDKLQWVLKLPEGDIFHCVPIPKDFNVYSRRWNRWVYHFLVEQHRRCWISSFPINKLAHHQISTSLHPQITTFTIGADGQYLDSLSIFLIFFGLWKKIHKTTCCLVAISFVCFLYWHSYSFCVNFPKV